MYDMRPTCVVHVVWRHFIPEPSTPFSWVLWSVLWLHHQFVTDVTAWLINPNPSCSKNRKLKRKKSKIKMKRKNKIKSTINNLDMITMLSSCWMWIFLLLSWCILNKLNENWSEKLSITLWPDKNSEWRGIKEEKISLNLLSMSTKWPLMEERWHSGRDPHSYILCLPQTYLRLWVQFLSSPLCWVTT